jgi:hypothetical protein
MALAIAPTNRSRQHEPLMLAVEHMLDAWEDCRDLDFLQMQIPDRLRAAIEEVYLEF